MWVLTDDITTDNGIPFLSVRICLFVHILLQFIRLMPIIRPPKGDII